MTPENEVKRGPGRPPKVPVTSIAEVIAQLPQLLFTRAEFRDPVQFAGSSRTAIVSTAPELLGTQIVEHQGYLEIAGPPRRGGDERPREVIRVPWSNCKYWK